MRSVLTAAVSLAAETVQRLHTLHTSGAIKDKTGTAPHALDLPKLFLKPLVVRRGRLGGDVPDARQRSDANHMFHVFDLLSQV